MNSPVFTLNMKDVHGVTAYVDSEKVQLMFRSTLQLESWHVLLKIIDDLIKENLLNWHFDLTELNYPSSLDIGMWITCITRIKLKSGISDFIVKKDSNVHKLLEDTNLIKIFDVVLVT